MSIGVNQPGQNKNGNRLDNRPENLEIISASEHGKIHYPSNIGKKDIHIPKEDLLLAHKAILEKEMTYEDIKIVFGISHSAFLWKLKRLGIHRTRAFKIPHSVFKNALDRFFQGESPDNLCKEIGVCRAVFYRHAVKDARFQKRLKLKPHKFSKPVPVTY